MKLLIDMPRQDRFGASTSPTVHSLDVLRANLQRTFPTPDNADFADLLDALDGRSAAPRA